MNCSFPKSQHFLLGPLTPSLLLWTSVSKFGQPHPEQCMKCIHLSLGSKINLKAFNNSIKGVLWSKRCVSVNEKKGILFNNPFDHCRCSALSVCLSVPPSVFSSVAYTFEITQGCSTRTGKLKAGSKAMCHERHSLIFYIFHMNSFLSTYHRGWLKWECPAAFCFFRSKQVNTGSFHNSP